MIIVAIVWKPKETLPMHPNGMTIGVIGPDGEVSDEWTYYSIGFEYCELTIIFQFLNLILQYNKYFLVDHSFRLVFGSN